jgi:hypothetical protein
MIWDLRRSLVNSASQQGERIVLPRIQDLVDSTLDLCNLCQPGETVRILVPDFVNAFHLIPVAAKERKYYRHTSAGFSKSTKYLCSARGRLQHFGGG